MILGPTTTRKNVKNQNIFRNGFKIDFLKVMFFFDERYLYLYFLFAIIYEILKADILEFFFFFLEISVRFDNEKGFISS